tara:strand:- start:2185 stop:2421 length:237 start_codon:yes stop_codon:yes gene_type:complete
MMSRNVFKGEVSSSERKPKHRYTKEKIYTKEYSGCKDASSRFIKMANNASDNGRCWWIYNYIMANSKYKGYGNGNNRR